MTRRLPLRAVFAMPAALAVASAVGLLAGLLGSGLWDVVSWLGLAAPVVAVARALRARRAP